MKKGEHNGRMAPGDRGLYEYGAIVDTRDQTIVVRTSSSAEERACWVFTKDAYGKDAVLHLGKPQARSPHLNPSQARRLAAALLRLADEADE